MLSNFKITTVKIEVDGREIKNVKIDGRKDIFENEDVRHFLDNRDGRIVQIEGEMKYENKRFDFQAGYGESLGRVKVEKKGSPEGDLEVVEEAFEFLDDIYKRHFVDI